MGLTKGSSLVNLLSCIQEKTRAWCSSQTGTKVNTMLVKSSTSHNSTRKNSHHAPEERGLARNGQVIGIDYAFKYHNVFVFVKLGVYGDGCLYSIESL